MNLTKNFTLEELTYSATASVLKIPNKPNKEQIENLKRLAISILQPIRDKFGAVTISSGFRCNELNKKVGGKPNSQHLKGQAADIGYVNKTNPKDVFKYIKDNLDYDQLLYENSGGIIWIHVSYVSKEKNRRMAIDNYKA